MNHNEADNLVMRMADAWGRVPGEEWNTYLAGLDAGKAGTAFIRLRNSSRRFPSIAEFGEAYGGVRDETPHEPCKFCDGTGQVWDVHAGGTDPFSGEPGSWVRCVCPEGEVRTLAAGRIQTSTKRIPSEQERTLGLDAIAEIRKQRQESDNPWKGKRWTAA